MDYTTLYLFIAFIVLGLLIVVLNRVTKNMNRKRDDYVAPKQTEVKPEESTDSSETAQKPVKPEGYVRPEGCCGAHEVCEKDTLITTKPDVVYFEDEELDRFKGRGADDYSSEEIAEFEDVLFTLKESEVSEWLKSIQMREIVLPQSVMDEALMIVAERRHI